VSLQSLKKQIETENTIFFLPTDEGDTNRGCGKPHSVFAPSSTKVAFDQLMASYEAKALAELNYRGAAPLPRRRTIIRILKVLLSILFPGYHGSPMNSPTFKAKLRYRWAWLSNSLADQISLGMRFLHRSDGQDGWDANEYDEWACQKAEALLAEIPRIRWTLTQDVRAALQRDPAVRDQHEILLAYPGIYAVAVYRLAHHLAKTGVPLIPRIMSEHAHSMTGIDIHPQAQIGHGFFVDHGTGVVIGQTCVIGNNCTLYQGVTLGALYFPRDDDGNLIRGMEQKRHPTLEDNVIVYSNASVLGGETIVRRNSVIGANVWLSHSLPPETVAWIEERSLRYKPRPVSRAALEVGKDI
jgi:serine O-acetyltransferase